MSGTGGGIHPNNQHKAHECPYCWLVLYSKGALTNHVNREHWKEKAEMDKALAEIENPKIFTKPSLPRVLQPPSIVKGGSDG